MYIQHKFIRKICMDVFTEKIRLLMCVCMIHHLKELSETDFFYYRIFHIENILCVISSRIKVRRPRNNIKETFFYLINQKRVLGSKIIYICMYIYERIRH